MTAGLSEDAKAFLIFALAGFPPQRWLFFAFAGVPAFGANMQLDLVARHTCALRKEQIYFQGTSNPTKQHCILAPDGGRTNQYFRLVTRTLSRNTFHLSNHIAMYSQ